MAPIKKSVITFGIVALCVAAVACSDRIYMGEVKADAGTPGFTDPNSSDAAYGDGEGPRLECIGTECPDPWTTCVSEDGPTYKCGTDLQRDNNHCGSCDNKCLTYRPVHMTSRCVAGACELQCFSEYGEGWSNCNGLVDDGCEVSISTDPNNCGACGNRCAVGQPCIDGVCGCPPGFVVCYGIECVDARSNDSHCGACGNRCKDPPDACNPKQPNTKYGCFESKCGKKQCQDGYADCNGDVGQSACGGDGCETKLNTKDNCGECGVKCTKPHEECINEGNGYECAVPCERFGKVRCSDDCVDLLTDIYNCGACGSGCKIGGANQLATCRKGVCLNDCAPGFADCNGDPTDGCETNLRIHPGNCGACGNACDVAAGQPCIEGQCLMTECDAGVPN